MGSFEDGIDGYGVAKGDSRMRLWWFGNVIIIVVVAVVDVEIAVLLGRITTTLIHGMHSNIGSKRCGGTRRTASIPHSWTAATTSIIGTAIAAAIVSQHHV